MNKTLLHSLVAGIVAAGGAGAQASVLFNFQNGQTVNVGAWDWSQSTFLARNGSLAVENFSLDSTCPGTSCDFTVYSHAYLTGVRDATGNNVAITGLNTDFEITAQFAFTERVTGLTGAPGGVSIANFAALPGTGEFLEIFYDTNPNVNDLYGSGFNDGRVILTGGLVNDTQGLFAVTNASPVQLDQFPAGPGPVSDNYGDGAGLATSQQTLTGFGVQSAIMFDDLNQSNGFFKQQLDVFGIDFNNVSIALPASQVNPSDCFDTSANGPINTVVANGTGACAPIHVDTFYSGQLPDPNGGYLPVTGSVNGQGPTFNPSTGGPDFVAQTDFNSSFVAVPEPVSVALLGVGLAGIGFSRSRKRLGS